MYFLFKMGIFHCYVCLPEGMCWNETFIIKNYIPPKLYVRTPWEKKTKNTWNATTQVWKMIFISKWVSFRLQPLTFRGGVIWKTKPVCWEDVFSCLNNYINLHLSCQFFLWKFGVTSFSPWHPWLTHQLWAMGKQGTPSPTQNGKGACRRWETRYL